MSPLVRLFFVPISAQKFILQIFCWNVRQRCLLGSIRPELYWMFGRTMLSYFFLSKIARTLKYAWAVPVCICNIINYTGILQKPFVVSRANVPIVWFKFPEPVSGPNYSNLLSIISCLCCPVCAVLSILSCLFYPYVLSCLFQSSSSLLAVLSWQFFLDSHSVSVLTIINYCPPGPVLFFLSFLFCSLSCPAFPVYIVLPWNCPALSSLFPLFCSDILFGILSNSGFYETASLSCLLCPTFLSVLSCLLWFYHSIGIAISFQKTCPLCSAQGLLSCSVFSYFPVCHLFAVPTLLSCRITPVLPFLSLFSWTTFTLLYTAFIIACPAPCSKVFLLSTPVLSLAVRPVSCPVCHNWSILLRSSIQTHSAI